MLRRFLIVVLIFIFGLSLSACDIFGEAVGEEIDRITGAREQLTRGEVNDRGSRETGRKARPPATNIQANYPFTLEFWEAWADREMPRNQTRRLMVEDFDYMIEILHDNFPYFAMAERRFDISIEELIWNTRTVLAGPNYNLIDSYDFWWVVWNYFTRPLQSIGHLHIQDPDVIHLTLANVYRGPMDWFGEFLYMGDREFTYWGEIFRDIVRSERAQQFYGYIELDLGNYEEDMIEPDNITTAIIADGVAYISVAQFMHYNIEYDKEIVFAFYEQIADFEHLIIDLRGNPGGFMRHFVRIFMMPNIAEDVVVQIPTMFMGNHYNMQWVQADFDDAYFFGDGYIMQVWDAQEYIGAGSFPYINPDDLGNFDYLLYYATTIPATGEVMFGGKIWILLDEYSASASEYSALFARAANFGTLVGAPTRGVTGGGMAGFFALPNSGLIVRHDIGYFIDEYGRAIDEFGVMPDIFNFDGMDALETVLSIIGVEYEIYAPEVNGEEQDTNPIRRGRSR